MVAEEGEGAREKKQTEVAIAATPSTWSRTGVQVMVGEVGEVVSRATRPSSWDTKARAEASSETETERIAETQALCSGGAEAEGEGE